MAPHDLLQVSGKPQVVSGTPVAKAMKMTKGAKAMGKVMKEWKAGTLNSGMAKGPVVKSQKQAIAIGLSVKAKASKGGRKKMK